MYLYASNSPTNFTDPWGLCGSSPGLGLLKAAIGRCGPPLGLLWDDLRDFINDAAHHLANPVAVGILAGVACYEAGIRTSAFLATRAPLIVANPEGGTELAGLTVGISCLVGAAYEFHKHHIGGWP